MKMILIPVILLITSLFSFGYSNNFNSLIFEKSDTIKIITVRYSDSLADSSAYINIDYPQITDYDNKIVQERVNSFLKKEFQQSISEYNELVADTVVLTGEDYNFTYGFETGFEIQFNSTKFLSITLDHYQYTGGAHGNYYSAGYNINMNDGKILTLSDIINNSSFNLLSYECEQAMLDTFQLNSLQEAGLFENEISILPDQDFYIIPGALVLQFDPYEIGPFAMGEISIEISFFKIKDILKTNLPFPTE